jgi:RimJ/RimL family protein N-acetyltransferase
LVEVKKLFLNIETIRLLLRKIEFTDVSVLHEYWLDKVVRHMNIVPFGV